jgi:glutamyl/glutaminyl-tRNA synthetase
MSVRVRFAPAPTGELHVGGAMVAVANHLLRLQQGGAFVLRVDDTDPAAHADGAAERIEAMLAWLGIAVDEGPDAGPHAPYRQSLRVEEHLAAADRLIDAGVAQRAGDGSVALVPVERDIVIDDLSRGAIRIPAGELPRTILVRADGRPTFHLATAADDAAMAITHVLRGEDHITNTAIQLVLCEGLGIEPPRFAHLPIVVGEDGAKLSSSDGAASVDELRAAGWLPSAVVDWLARSACPPITALPAASVADLAAAFDPTRLGHGTTRLDPLLLERLGRDHLALMPSHELAHRVGDELDRDGIACTRPQLDALAPGLGDAATIRQAAALVADVLERRAPLPPTDADRAAATALLECDTRDPDALAAGKKAIRRVLTSSDHGIPLPFLLAALPRDEIVARAQAVLDQP